MTTHYAVRVETSARFPKSGAEAFVDDAMTKLEAWHPALSSEHGHVVATITLPADSLGQAVATALAVVAQVGTPIAVEALPEEVRDQRQGLAPVPDLLSVTEVAEQLGVTRQRVLAMIDSGKVPATRVGTTYAVQQSAVDALLAARTAVAEQPAT